MPVIFHDDLESGMFSPEVQFQKVFGEVNVVTPGLAGSYGGQFVTQPTLEFAHAQAEVGVDLAEVYAGAYFQINKPTVLGVHDRFYLIRALARGGSLAIVGVRREGDKPARWTLWYRETTDPHAGTHTMGGLFNFTPRRIWVELHYNRALGLYEVFVDGHLEISMTVAPVNPNVDMVQFGVYKPGASGTPWDPTTEYLIDVFSDELTVGTEYLGPPEEPPPPMCFIATAAYGTPFAKEISVLRSFRDRFMFANKAGEGLVHLYYLTSPPLAKIIAKHELFRVATRTVLKPLINRLKR